MPHLRGVKLVKTIDRQESGAAVLQKQVMLYRVDDIVEWPGFEENGVVVRQPPKIDEDAYSFRVYMTPVSQEFSFDSGGKTDEGGFKQKLSGTHPGMPVSALEFCKKYLHDRFIAMFSDCDGTTVILGTPCNPLVFTSGHKSSRAGRKFTFNFEQEIESENVYMIGLFDTDEQPRLRYFDESFDNSFN